MCNGITVLRHNMSLQLPTLQASLVHAIKSAIYLARGDRFQTEKPEYYAVMKNDDDQQELGQ